VLGSMLLHMSEPHSESSTQDTPRIPTTSQCLPDGSLIELLYDPIRRETALARWQDGKASIHTELTVGRERLIPFSPHNNIIKHNVVLLPSEPAEYGTKDDLVEAIRRYLHRYLDVSPAFEDVAANYILFSWVYDAFNEVPYIRFQGDYGTGKTRALLVVGSVCYKPFFASGASTVSPIFHILDAFRGTLILDEADFRFSDEKAEIVKVLNNGNVDGMPVLRTMMNRQREFNPQAFRVFGPKVVGMRKAYADQALESRFLTEVMSHTALRADIPINLPNAMKEEAQRLRNQLLLFRFRNRHAVGIRSDALASGLAPRGRQILLPLLSIVDDERIRSTMIAFAATA